MPVMSNQPNVPLTSTQPTANMPLRMGTQRPSAFNVQQQQQPPQLGMQQGAAAHMKPQMGVTKPTPTPSLQLMKGDSFRFTEPDENTLLKQVQSTHLPDGRAIEVKPLIHIVEGIFKHADPSVGAISDLVILVVV